MCSRHVACPGRTCCRASTATESSPDSTLTESPMKFYCCPSSRASSPFQQPVFTSGVNIADLPLSRTESPSPHTQGSMGTPREARRVTGPLSPPQNSTHIFTASLWNSQGHLRVRPAQSTAEAAWRCPALLSGSSPLWQCGFSGVSQRVMAQHRRSLRPTSCFHTSWRTPGCLRTFPLSFG